MVEAKRDVLSRVSDVVERVAGLLGKPNPCEIPSPITDPYGYNRHRILLEERECYYNEDEGGILTAQDLSPDVLQWAETNYPGSFSTQAIRLHMIKKGWQSRHPMQLGVDPKSWEDALETGEWKGFVPKKDFKTK